MKQAAYSILEIKTLGTDEQRVITGLATSPVPDRVGDVIDPFGVQVATDVPLFLYHDSTKTVGRARFGKPTRDGIPFTATLPKITEPGVLKDRVDEAWQMLRTGLLRGVSIGFRVIGEAFERLNGGGTRYLKIEVLELSLVPVPMHQLATIETVKAAADLAIQRAQQNTRPNQGSTAMRDLATLSVNSQLELAVHFTSGAKSINLQLSRISAQHLADELQAFATTRKAVNGLREVGLGVEVLPARAPQQGVVRLGSGSNKAHPGLVYIGKPAAKKTGLVYLDTPSAAGKRPVIRLTPKR